MSALRDTQGKLDWILLFEHFPLAMKELCRAREFGARHYTKDGKNGATNWRESINGPEHEKFFKGCIRGNISHNFKVLWGERRDEPQDNVHHLAFGALNDLMALEYALNKEQADTTLVDALYPTEPEAYAISQGNESRYDWSKIPYVYNWVATNRDGGIVAFIGKPWAGNDEWVIFRTYPCHVGRVAKCSDWEDSLERRPS